nr:immunoglobulin heavy chain junction region [Macaca mulatta]
CVRGWQIRVRRFDYW